MRDGYIPGVPCWYDTNRQDPEAAAEFYAGLFGWELEDTMPPGSPAQYLVARLGGGDVAAIGSQPEGAPPDQDWNTYVWVESADAAVAKVTAAGGSVIVEAFDVLDAGRMAICADLEGASFCLWQPGTHKGAQVVNEHGSCTFNTLHTRDPERAKAFYGAVFGWNTIGSDSNAMWTLPGYAEFLERDDPGLRERMADSGAPDGFADVVATLSRSEDTPHWAITFGVDDADVTAAEAEALGGRVVVAPFDAPWVRMTLLADPQGVTFTASQFVPENRDLGGAAA